MFLSGAVSSGYQMLTFSRAGLSTRSPSTLHGSQSLSLPLWMLLLLVCVSSQMHVFYPFCLVGRCLQKVVLYQATSTVVVPLWWTQAWFTRLLSLLVDHTRIVKVTKGVLHNPIHGQMHPLSPKLNLLVCRISQRS